MKAITLWQPWAGLVAVGMKCVETRSWSTRYRGPLAIHAARRIPGAAEEAIVDRALAIDFDRADLLDDLELGVVVAIAELCHVIPIGDPDEDPTGRALIHADPGVEYAWSHEADDTTMIHPHEEPFGDYTPGRYAWLLGAVEALAPAPEATGRQGLWTWDEAGLP